MVLTTTAPAIAVRRLRKATLQIVLAVGLGVVGVAPAAAQDGTLRGTITDNTGATLPGATVTATSPALIGTREAVTDEGGLYRLGNLPPGSYVVTAQLQGFTVARRENVDVRAGANFQVDFALELGSLQETILVTAESPMIETQNPTNVLNVTGELQRSLPLLEGKNVVDVMEITPGVFGRVASTAPRTLYFAAAADQNDNVAEFEGFYAATVNDTTINRVTLTPEAVEDTQMKTGGQPASSPMGKGIIMSVTLKSGGNQFSGSLGHTLQPFSWNNDNVPEGRGVPSQRQISQTDYALGGPIMKDKVWFFTAGRYQDNAIRVGRTDIQAANLQALFPGQEAEDSLATGFQPVGKVTARFSDKHTLLGLAQYDVVDEFNAVVESLERMTVSSIGGWLYGTKLTSAWSDSLMTSFSVGYNNKAGNTLGSYEGKFRDDPRFRYYQSTRLSSGRPTGVGELGWSGGTQGLNGCISCRQIESGTMPMLRGDLTWFKRGWIGQHEFQGGFLAYPNVQTERLLNHNDEVLAEDYVLLNPNNVAGGSRPFHRNLVTSGTTVVDLSSRNSNYGVYVQDVWRPNGRVTVTLGLRSDSVRRFDRIKNLETQSSNQLAPRAGVSYLLTDDARNVVRGSFSRLFDVLQVGNNPMATHGAERVSALADTYDLDGDGVFETRFEDPLIPSNLAPLLFDENMRQPGIDEWIAGYRGQYPGRLAVDVSYIHRRVFDRFAQVDINGIYPEGPNQPFGGFGLIDPNQGAIYKIVNQDQQAYQYHAVELIVTKQMSSLQLLGSIHRQWQHITGTWNATDPARFIQPDAFPNNGTLTRTRVKDSSSYTGDENSSNWSPLQMRAGATWTAPFDIVVAATYTLLQIQKSGPILTQLAANDPTVLQFGPATVVSPNGRTFSNPLATTFRFAYPTRSEGQLTLPNMQTWSLKVGKLIGLGSSRKLDVGLNIFNLLNSSDAQNWATGAWQDYNTVAFGQPGAIQRSRSFELDATFRF
jgi:hypothetical protein